MREIESLELQERSLNGELKGLKKDLGELTFRMHTQALIIEDKIRCTYGKLDKVRSKLKVIDNKK